MRHRHMACYDVPHKIVMVVYAPAWGARATLCLPCMVTVLMERSERHTVNKRRFMHLFNEGARGLSHTIEALESVTP